MHAEDLDALLQDYATTAYIVIADGVIRGKDGIRAFFAGFFQLLPRAQWTSWTAKTTFADNVLLLEWTAESARGRVSDGVDTVLFQDGLIQCQTIHFTVVPTP